MKYLISLYLYIKRNYNRKLEFEDISNRDRNIKYILNYYL